MDPEVKIDKLISKMAGGREDHIAEVVSMRKTIKTAMLKKNLKEHPALVQLLNLLKKRDESYTIILANKEDLDEVSRRGYFERRKEVRFILSFFSSAEPVLNSIDKKLDYYLSEDVDQEVDNS